MVDPRDLVAAAQLRQERLNQLASDIRQMARESWGRESERQQAVSGRDDDRMPALMRLRNAQRLHQEIEREMNAVLGASEHIEHATSGPQGPETEWQHDRSHVGRRLPRRRRDSNGGRWPVRRMSAGVYFDQDPELEDRRRRWRRTYYEIWDQHGMEMIWRGSVEGVAGTGGPFTVTKWELERDREARMRRNGSVRRPACWRVRARG